jgi:hypothetical protein
VRNPKVDLNLAKELAMNALMLKTIRDVLHATAMGTEQAVVYSDAINPLLIEKEQLIEKAFHHG